EQMQEELKSLQKSLRITFVFVTHDQGEALSMADRIAVFNEGRVMQIGTPEEIYKRPRSRFVADFVGSSNVLAPDFVARHGGPRQWASLRPEALRVAMNGVQGGIAATVVGRAYLGASVRLSLDAGGERLHAVVPAGTALPDEGATVTLHFDRADLHLMEDQS